MKKVKFAWIVLVLLAFVAALAYLPFAGKFGYFNDDWYEMYMARVNGPQIFHTIFSIDRPLRAYLMIPVYWLFGEHPLWYSISAYIFRVLGAFALWWMLHMLWPKAKTATVLMALLFVIYPGFASQPNAIDYQSHIVALALAQLSLALMVKAFQIPGLNWKRVALLMASALCGWAYLGLMEYYIGFELIRFLLIVLLAVREEVTWRTRVKKILMNGLPLTLIGGLFIFWHEFIFVGERKATDAGAQLGMLRLSPVETISHWASSLLQSAFATLVMVWGAPLSQLIRNLTLPQKLTGFGLGLLCILALYFALKNAGDADNRWRSEAFWLGLASVFAGLIPVILANREVYFPYVTRYTLISSMGVGIMIVAVISWVPWKIIRAVAISGLILAAILTQFANSIWAAQLTTSNNDFWWQVSWRIPALKNGVTLIANYPLVNSEEDYFIWGPANLIYATDILKTKKNIQPSIYAAVPNTHTVQGVLSQTGQEYYQRRGITTFTNYRNILILTQPTPNSCVQVIDGQNLEISTREAKNFAAMAPYSNIGNIITDSPAHTPPPIIFGPEPAHDWCYFYEKASLARQRGDWEAVAKLGDQAMNQKLAASDLIEWIPFLQGYAILDKTNQEESIGARFAGKPALAAQVCKIFNQTTGLNVNMQKQVERLFCGIIRQ